MIETLVAGGPVMVPIGLCSLIALAVFMERLWALRASRVVPRAFCIELVELARRIGRDQVENTPPWHRMEPADFQAWTEGSLEGETLYFWGDGSETLEDAEPAVAG